MGSDFYSPYKIKLLINFFCGNICGHFLQNNFKLIENQFTEWDFSFII